MKKYFVWTVKFLFNGKKLQLSFLTKREAIQQIKTNKKCLITYDDCLKKEYVHKNFYHYVRSGNN